MSKTTLIQGGKKVSGGKKYTDPVTGKTTSRSTTINGVTTPDFKGTGGSSTYHPPAARGDDFAAAFAAGGGPDIVKKTGGSIADAVDVINGYKGSGAVAAQARALAAQRQREIARARKERRSLTGNKATTSLADAGRASTLDTTEAQSESTSDTGSSDPATQLSEVSQRAEELRRQVQEFADREKTAGQDIVATDTPVVNQEGADQEFIGEAKFKSPSMDAVTLLDRELARLKDELKSDQSAIKSDFNVQKSNLESKQASETGQTSVGLANMGGYLGGSGSGQGVLLKLAESHRAELMDLHAQRQKALADAETAYRERRWEVVSAKAEEIKRIDQETYDREEAYNKRVRDQAEVEAKDAENIKDQKTIFDAIQAGHKSAEDIYKSLQGAMPIEKINSFLEGLTPTKSTDSFKFTGSETASLLGAGLSQEDIAALHDTVNELGYTDEVRAALPASVRAVADKIYRAKTGTGGGTDDSDAVTIDGTKVSSVTLQVIDGFTKLDKLTPTAQQKVRDELFDLGFSDANPPSWFNVDFVGDSIGVPNLHELYSTYDNGEQLQDDFVRSQWNKMRTDVFKKSDDEGDSSLDFEKLPEPS